MTDPQSITAQLPIPRQDGALLHFLKELPAWVIIGVFIILFLLVFYLTQVDFAPRIIDQLVGALLAVIVTNRLRSSGNMNVSTENIETQTMNDATVNANSIQLKKE